MSTKVPDTVLMVDPEYFATAKYETDIDIECFRKEIKFKGEAIQSLAKDEFYEMVNYIRSKNIRVITMKSPKNASDAVFPNDWLSTHVIDGQPYVFIYPMYAESRRREVQADELLKKLKEQLNIDFKLKDFRGDHSKFLEGNATLVFDNVTKKVFLSKSLRANETIAKSVADELGYELISFTGYDHKDNPIFQTTQMLSTGEKLIFACLEAIKCEKERQIVSNALQESGKTIINISKEQLPLRCCNTLEVKTNKE